MDMNIEKSILKRIQKLLTLAKDKGASPAEAESAMAMAQRLMTKYGIEMANISDDSPKSSIKHEEFFTRKGGLNPADAEISSILKQFYKVKILFNGMKGLVIVGTPEDIEIAKYVHGYLRNIFFKCWNEYKKSVVYANKADFYFGLRTGIEQRMEEAENSVKAEESQEVCDKYELAINNNREAIKSYIFETFGKLGKSRRRASTRTDANSFYAGKAKGSTVQINQAIKA